jgi:hypothetical protein
MIARTRAILFFMNRTPTTPRLQYTEIGPSRHIGPWSYAAASAAATGFHSSRKRPTIFCRPQRKSYPRLIFLVGFGLWVGRFDAVYWEVFHPTSRDRHFIGIAPLPLGEEVAGIQCGFSSQSFWKAGSARKGSHCGSSLNSAGVTPQP